MRFAVIKGILKAEIIIWISTIKEHLQFPAVHVIYQRLCICDASEYIFVKVTRSYFLRLPMPS